MNHISGRFTELQGLSCFEMFWFNKPFIITNKFTGQSSLQKKIIVDLQKFLAMIVSLIKSHELK